MKIKLRKIVLEDAPFVLEIENNRNIWKVSHTIEVFSKKEIELFIAKSIVEGLDSGQERYIICYGNQNAGCIDLFDFDKKNKRAGIGIVIHPNFQNKGIATKSLELLIDKCRKEFDLHQLYCTVLADNYNSIRLFEKQGFEKSGIRKDWTFFEGKYYDEIFYQLKL